MELLPPRASRMMLVRTTFGSEAEARDMARGLIERRQACCVHVQPIQSVYRWEGAIEETEEWLLEARTPAEHAEALWEAVLAAHPYDTPLVELAGPTRVPRGYADWADHVTA